MDLALNNLQRLICHKTQPTLFMGDIVVLNNIIFLLYDITQKKNQTPRTFDLEENLLFAFRIVGSVPYSTAIL